MCLTSVDHLYYMQCNQDRGIIIDLRAIGVNFERENAIFIFLLKPHCFLQHHRRSRYSSLLFLLLLFRWYYHCSIRKKKALFPWGPPQYISTLTI